MQRDILVGLSLAAQMSFEGTQAKTSEKHTLGKRKVELSHEASARYANSVLLQRSLNQKDIKGRERLLQTSSQRKTTQ